MATTVGQIRRVAGAAAGRCGRRWAGVLAVTVACLLLPGCGDGGDDEGPAAADLPTCPASDPSLPGMRTGEAPWPPELEQLGERLDRLGLPRLTQEGVALDLHVQLSVEVQGRPVEIPTSIGLNGEEVAGGRMVSGFVSAIHTHDASGLVHVHSPDVRPYTLGQLFDVWGVTLSEERIGGYCVDAQHELTVEADGDVVSEDPRELPLADGQRVDVSYGGE